jgi:two-component sensor histidine kinase
VLLKEVHHRVKNNLQIISSLFGLQARYLDVGRARTALLESQTRVHAIALVHEKLHESTSSADVDFASYTRSLVGAILHAVGCPAHVQLVVDIAPIRLGVDQAIPCGLLVNELVTNAVKHAFTGRESGEIHLSLEEREDRGLCLSVRDDGVGMPAEIDPGNTASLGLKVVAALAVQLAGTFEIDRDRGTRISVNFRRP